MFGSAKHGKAHKSSKADRHASRTDGGSQNVQASFFFVVNEIELSPEPPLESDRWGNIIPPARPNYYARETVGRVFRYNNGTVTPAEGYQWVRQAWGAEGHIYYPTNVVDEYGNNMYPLQTYSSSTVFDLGPFFPCAYALVDATTHDISMNEAPWNTFYALQFNNQDGVSRAFFNGGSKFIAGSASWLERLVPAAYRTPPGAERFSPTPLGGELGAVLGLMALAERPGRTDHAFSSHWNENIWHGTRHETVSPHGPPRGVLVYVAVDPTRSTGEEDITHFENHGYAVRG
ncbi:hypothetical protein F5X96DRAFT_684815 [Biscogniauxia mediterranea]|nr:hypothetical protein F5X96DRAFT_684815 [Biscogniauxia mediterranea]